MCVFAIGALLFFCGCFALFECCRMQKKTIVLCCIGLGLLLMFSSLIFSDNDTSQSKKKSTDSTYIFQTK